MKNKIFRLDILKNKILKLKKQNKKIVICHGVFDVLHVGHIKHFTEAKKEGDILIISVTSDKYVNKGTNRPLFNQNLRMEMLASLALVDFVVLSDFKNATKTISAFKPNFYVKGQDYNNEKRDTSKNIIIERKLVERFGGKLIITNQQSFSSSKIINENFTFNSQQKKNLNKINKKFTFNNIRKIFEKIKKLRVLVIGETIIDQYNFCEALGKSGKEPYLAFKDLYSKNYLGGAAAIANHIADFVKEVKLLSMIGRENNYKNFIIQNLKKNVKNEFFIRSESPTILKKRFLDSVSKNKIFGVYSMNDQKLDSKDDTKVNKLIKKNLNSYDLLIVSDYGHGFLSEKNSKLICKTKKFLSLNAQVNASNIGYHTMKKYNNVNAMIINETELRHEMRDKNEDIYKLSKKLLKLINISDLVVTRGSNGAILTSKNLGKNFSSPAFANKLIDKVGAGDTMLALISPLLKVGTPKELALLIGSFAGAFSVETMGNSKFLDKNKIIRSLEFSLK